MKRVILLLLGMTIFSQASYGQEKGLLYEVSGKGLAVPSYLYGTFHMLCPADVQMSEAIRKAFTASTQLYLELDFDDPSLQVAMMNAMRAAPGKSARDLLSAADYATLDTYLVQNLGAGLGQMASFKPIAWVSFVYGALLRCQPVSYDETFAEMAARDKKAVLGLESVQEQLAILDRIPLEEQLKELVDVARKPDEARKELMSLIAAYKAQDLSQLMKLLAESDFVAETEGLEHELLDKRNTNWIPVIEKAAREKSTFFAFGAGHLWGPKGVVNLLRQQGFTVKTVN